MGSIGEDITIKLIKSTEIQPDMKILDLGCGNGDVSFLLSGYIGTDGLVVGVDSNESAVANANNKAQELRLNNVKFYSRDITQELEIGFSDFDIIIVRRVLMYLSDPEKAIKNAIKNLKSNGIFLAQENQLSLTPFGLELMPKHKKIIDLIRKTLEKENMNFNMGLDLNATLTRSGMSVEKIWAEAVLSTPNQHTQWAFLAQVMKDRMIKHGVINNVSELELEILSEELYQERIQNSNTIVSDLVFCAVARK